MDGRAIELDVGGKTFRTTRSTLCSFDGYFARMLQNGNWAEGNNSQQAIFIDRDHTTFGGILSYLRSGQLLVSGNEDDVYLEKLLCEADYYQLSLLSEGLKAEIAKRKQRAAERDRVGRIMHRVVGAPDVDRYFTLGWTYVANYQGNETTACSSSGSKVEALYRTNQCTACGEHMSYEKFCKHVTFFRPTQVVVQRHETLAIPNSGSLQDLDVDGLVFDQSFG